MKKNYPFSDSAARVSTIFIIILVLGSGQLCGQAPAVRNILLIHGTFADGSGLVYFDKTKFHAGFCADLPASQAEFMSASQIPGSVKAFTAVITHAPWKLKPCWGILGTEDKAINPILLRRLYQRSNAKTTEIKGSSHVSFISHPNEVAVVIEEAATTSH